MVRTTLTLAGALAAFAFCWGTAHADDAPVPIGPEFNLVQDGYASIWLDEATQYNQDFSLPDDPASTFEGVVHYDFAGVGGVINDYNVSVGQDLTGNVPIGEQYNDLNIYGFNEVYTTFGGTPEAFLVTPFGDLNFPTWFVDAVGPSFFEPSWLMVEPFTPAAAELPGLAADVPSLLAGLL